MKKRLILPLLGGLLFQDAGTLYDELSSERLNRKTGRKKLRLTPAQMKRRARSKRAKQARKINRNPVDCLKGRYRKWVIYQKVEMRNLWKKYGMLHGKPMLKLILH
jgi:hypothetical protein